jgi:hypothetical protein
MRKSTTAPLIFITLLAANTSYAGWNNLLDNAKTKGTQLLQQHSKDTGNKNISTSSLSADTLIKGLREALVVASERAIKLISAPGGYLNDPQIRVPLPAGLDTLAGTLRQFGMGKQVDQFEQSINRAAELAAPKATAILIDHIKSMSFEDARKIYEGNDDAATQYFQAKAGPKIAALFTPHVEGVLSEVRATRYYNDLASQAAKLPVVGKKVNTDLTKHVTHAALDGLFMKLAVQEKLIRKNPAAQTSKILKQLWSK